MQSAAVVSPAKNGAKELRHVFKNAPWAMLRVPASECMAAALEASKQQGMIHRYEMHDGRQGKLGQQQGNTLAC